MRSISEVASRYKLEKCAPVRTQKIAEAFQAFLDSGVNFLRLQPCEICRNIRKQCFEFQALIRVHSSTTPFESLDDQPSDKYG